MANESVAMMRRVIEMETTTKRPSYVELFKGTDLRRTLIVAGVYLAQNLTGNLIANQAVYFFTRKSHLQWCPKRTRSVLTLIVRQRQVWVRNSPSRWASSRPPSSGCSSCSPGS